MIVLLQLEIRLDQALQDLVAIGAQRIAQRRLVRLVGCTQEGGERRRNYGLQKNVRIRGAGSRPEVVQIVPVNQKKMPRRLTEQSWREIHLGKVVP